jgi:hypothetical protein
MRGCTYTGQAQRREPCLGELGTTRPPYARKIGAALITALHDGIDDVHLSALGW